MSALALAGTQDTQAGADDVPLTNAQRRAAEAQRKLGVTRTSRYTLDDGALWAPIEDEHGRVLGESAVCRDTRDTLYLVFRSIDPAVKEQAIPYVAVTAAQVSEQI